MISACALPDGDLGVALRLSSYLDCQSRVLGENGFQAFASSPISAAMLSGLATIFVALIGYRMLLGAQPTVRDGVAWSARLGIVIALLSSWPAFNALVYRVAIEGPREVAGVILPASGLATSVSDRQIQSIYDLLREGSPTPPQNETPNAAAAAASTQGQPAAEAQKTPSLQADGMIASLLVISTIGLSSGLKLTTAFLLAIAPVATLGLLFRATVGLFDGWLRALAGAVLAALAARVTGAIEMVAIRSEIPNIQALLDGAPSPVFDPQTLPTIILFFTLVAAVMTWAAFRMASAIGTSAAGLAMPQIHISADQQFARPETRQAIVSRTAQTPHATQMQSRAGAVADALSAAIGRDRAAAIAATMSDVKTSVAPPDERFHEAASQFLPIGSRGRRSTGRRSASAARRDNMR